MKRGLSEADSPDLSAKECEYIQSLKAEDYRATRAEAGIPDVCELMCDTLYDPGTDFDTFFNYQPAPQSSNSSSGTVRGDTVAAESGSLGAPATFHPPVSDAWTSYPPLEARNSSGSSGQLREGLPPAMPPAPHATCMGFAQSQPQVYFQEGQTGSPAPEPARKPGGRGRAGSRNPSSSALAQRRYHQRQKAKKEDSVRQLEDLSRQMEALLQEKAELEVKNRILSKDLTTWQDHLEQLWGKKSMRIIQQRFTLKLTADLMGKAVGRSIPLAEAERWTIEEYAHVHYQAFQDRLKELCCMFAADPKADTLKQLTELVKDQNDMDRRGGLSSCIHWGTFSYNLHHTKTLKEQNQLPTLEFWDGILASMHLTPEQEEQILCSYECMHRMLVKCAAERNNVILPELGMGGASYHKEEMHLSEAGNKLYHSFRLEQTSILGFLLAVDKLLTPEQFGCLEAFSYPWSPEWLPMCGLLRTRRKGLPPLQFPNFGDHCLDLPLLPYKTAFQVLEMTVTSLGIGLRMRHGVIMCPFETVLSRYCFPVPPFERLKQMTLLDIMIGNWRTWSCWCWMTKVREGKRLVENKVIPEEEYEKGQGVVYPSDADDTSEYLTCL